MKVTVIEAAEALDVHFLTVVRWYNERHDVTAPKRALLDTEEFCRLVGMDHTVFSSFLSGYDQAIKRDEVRQITGLKTNNVAQCILPALSFGKCARYSRRAVAHWITKKLEAKNEAPKLPVGCSILPPATEIPGFEVN